MGFLDTFVIVVEPLLYHEALVFVEANGFLVLDMHMEVNPIKGLVFLFLFQHPPQLFHHLRSYLQLSIFLEDDEG